VSGTPRPAGRLPARLALAPLALALLAPAALDAQEAARAGKRVRVRDTATVVDTVREARRQRRADEAPLFAADAPLRLTLVTDLRALGGDRDTLKPTLRRGTVHVAGDDGVVRAIPVQVATRGHFRLRTCSFPPLRVVFDSGTAGTPFARQRALKLVTHCQPRGGGEQVVLREHLAYRAQALVMPIAFRTRVARVRYVDARDAARGDTARGDERWGMFLESEQALGARLQASVLPATGALFADVAPDSAASLALFQYFLGNTDWSLSALHNVRLLASAAFGTTAVPYDFDFSGLVDSGYGSPDPRLAITSVRQRLWRGPCASAQTLAAALRPYQERRAQLEALWREPIPGLDRGYAQEALRYVQDFYEQTRDPAAFARIARRDAPRCLPSN
jgi:hypothetical protein